MFHLNMPISFLLFATASLSVASQQKNRVIFFYASTPTPQLCATLTIGALRATLTTGGG